MLHADLDRIGGSLRNGTQPKRLPLAIATDKLDEAASVRLSRDTGHIDLPPFAFSRYAFTRFTERQGPRKVK